MRGGRALVLLLALAGPACSRGSGTEPPALVFAAASLTASFEALAEAFEAAHPGAEIALHFAGTPQLVVQIREGAPADVFASADEASMQRVIAGGHGEARPRVFATNRLTIVTPVGNPAGVAGLADLAREDLTVLLCAPDVPAGRYARQALEQAGVAVRSASDEPSVKAVASKVGLGEADAGVVYATDAAAARGRVEAVAVAAEHDVVARYPLAVLAGGENPATGAAFAEFALSPAGREILGSFGFGAP